MKNKKVSIGIILFLGMLSIGYIFIEPKDNKQMFRGEISSVRFERDHLELGSVKYNEKKEISFRYTNTGNTPFLIYDVCPSCDCTTVKWSKAPTKPGDSGNIQISFQPNSLGRFIKDIQVFCNTKEEMIKLKLSGNVLNE